MPVETTTEYGSWGFILAIGTVLFIMAVVLFIYSRERPIPVVNHKSGSFSTTLNNTTPYAFAVNMPSGTINLAPGDKRAVTLGMHETVSVEGVTPRGTPLSFRMQPTSEFDTLYITEGGFGTPSNTNSNVTFVNASQDDVAFVMISSGGGFRFPVDVSAGGTVGGNAVIIGQTWHVVKPKDPQKILAERVVRSMPTTLTFDGKSISVQ